MNDTIAAISTAMGVGAISIIRVSGKDSIKIVNEIFTGKDLNEVPTHTIHYGHIVDEKIPIDEVLITVMKSPKTYTKEDIVEINCHGGINTTNKILETVLNHGARLAEPGEFTKRAFLNGRLDLSQSEAVMDVINSKSNDDRILALKSLEGQTTKKIKKFRAELNDLISHIEVNIDFPEYNDIEVMTKNKIEKKLKNQITELKKIIEQSEDRQIIKAGIKTLIVGRPNVGKSSILNNLLEYDKAIVTNIEGTTRDIVEGNILLKGIPLNIIDTAGIRKTSDVIEQIGVKKSLSLINEADLVLVVLNGNEEITSEDLEILDKTKDKTSIVVINKSDLPQKINKDLLTNRIVVESTTTNEFGLENLKSKIIKMFNLDQISTLDQTYLNNARQLSLAKKALSSLEEAEKSSINNVPVDLIQIDLMDAFTKLGEIIGITYSEEVINNLFKNFCVGK
ncbi:tRNA modification GTPase TrmE [human gut metagenome]|uniref:tRNA modification GTPase TrmE n=1 Tax=human gut metagenome TaxID=408170 RepID=K1RQZ5_9ZZZZ